MKFKIVSALVLAFSLTLFTTGCKTTGSGSLPGTNAIVTAESAAKAAIVFKTTVRSLTFIAIRKDANAAAYFKAGAAALSLVLVQGDMTPESLAAALSATSINELHGVEAQLAINTLQGLYEAFYQDRVRASIDSQVYLRMFLSNALDGINLGIADVGAK